MPRRLPSRGVARCLGSPRLSASHADWLSFVHIFFGALLCPFGSLALQLLLDVLTGVDIEGNDDRLFPCGRRLFQVGQHFESGTGQLGNIVRQHEIDGTRAETSARGWC